MSPGVGASKGGGGAGWRAQWLGQLSFFFSSSEEVGAELRESGGREVGNGATKGGGD